MTEEKILELEARVAELEKRVEQMSQQMAAAGEKSKMLLNAARSGNPMEIFAAMKEL